MRVKRLLPLFMAFAMIGGVFAGCSSSGNDSTSEHTEHTGGTATCTQKAKCSVCGEEYGDYAAHSYTAESTESKYLKTAATCQAKAVYYKSCSVCGVAGTDTFESGNYGAHSYTENIDSKYIKSEATTTAKAVYYKSCSECGEASSTETFEYGEKLEESQTSTSFKIYVVGDSTVCSFSDAYYLPRYGYGTQLAQYFNVEESQVVNLALSGRSSKSFLTEANYTTLKDSISSGDYLIIGFGHNDEKSAEPARFTDPNGTKDTETTAKGTSFKYVLYNSYIKLAEEKNATPILCTPITRYDSTGAYSGSKVHVTEDGDYPAAIKELGTETNTTVIDLTALTVEEYKKDNAAAAYYHAHTTYETATDADIKAANTYDGTETPDGRDDTHINKYGARMVAYKFATALASTECSLKDYVKSGITQPTKADSYLDAINQSYLKTAYTAFDPSEYEANKLMTTTTNGMTAQWYHTAMGQLGGDTKYTEDYYKFTYTESTSSLTIKTDKGSKFAAKQDGFGAVFVQVDASKNFTASAHVKVTEIGSNAGNQGSFGLMLRDDIIIDKQDTTLASNFVSAGILTSSSSGDTAIFSRSSKTALTTTTNSATAAVGDEYDLSITRTGQTVICTVKTSGGTTYTETYTDFDFVAIDNNYMYLCLYAARGFVVDFTNISYEITGTSQGA